MKEDEDEKNLAIRARTDLPPLEIQPLTPLETEQISYLLEIQVFNILNMLIRKRDRIFSMERLFNGHYSKMARFQ